jgi:hypothetical protein
MEILEGNFCQKKTESGSEIWISSLWYPRSPEPISDEALCKVWVLYNSKLYYSDSDIPMDSCNPSLILSNFFSNLKRAFKENIPEYIFKFTEDDDNNTSTLEVLYKLSNEGISYISAFKTILIKSFKHNPLEEFLLKVAYVCDLKDVSCI